ncbi:GAF domain-containing protein [Methylobacterium sp. WL30]|uniref:sensor histidine kinase n=1 Tax=unclassified Methylobacterium TaxID=2615210 RepID=UPI0011C88099|nr:MULTISPECIES: histidine kinase dimerization/phosphoacceptor domain -containing protein [unclassified Methylobacterium]TXM87450.1 GAF domain-containing protein [Methylobacterium sp. WL116]TXN25654.1 GAF domain-containing protein [Methylobacterium sp. WL93]TXN49268.1 GAF domain-containing protein [Methylobacterium sp. WL119]TXN61942.1 GAF domain-containing protein [Methylobacterium sp. WL30]
MSDHHPDLSYRLRQQAILSEFGVEALRGEDVDALLQRATELCAEGMGAEFCKALEHLHDEDMLLVRAGVGWGPNVVGHARVGADLASPAGFALKTGRPVISNHLENENRFRTPQIMAEHGIRRAINVLIENREGAFGVLEVDDTREGMFTEADIAFMQGFANLLGGAIERQRTEGLLKQALARQDLLVREMSHRVKNSLAIVASLLALQARNADDPAVRDALIDARTRVEAIAGVHDQLWRQGDTTPGEIDLAQFLETLTANLQSSAPNHRIRCSAEPLRVSADRAIPMGLMVNELVTNAIKYAYPDRAGEVRVGAACTGAALVLDVSDDGVGLPADFDIGRASGSLGMRVIANLARQLDARIATPRGQGARFHIEIPLEA